MSISVSRRAALKSSAALGFLASFGCNSPSASPSSDSDLGKLDAVATAQAIKSGEVSASEVVEKAIERAIAVDEKINAIVTPYFDRARAAVASAPHGAWFGVPLFIKDLMNVAGQRTAYGSRAFAKNVAQSQSAFVDKLFSTGVINLGKSSSPEFGLTATTEPMSDGPTLNPWNLAHSTGGSSGGAAALVAAGVVPVAQASDGGGSIRIPAACCGVAGLKVSRGRYPLTDPPHNLPLEISVPGIEARSVRDVAAFIAMMEVDSALPKVGVVTGPSKERRRIGYFTKSPLGGPVDPQVAAVTMKTAERLSALGHEVEEMPVPFDAGMMQDFLIYWGMIAAGSIAKWEEIAGRKATYTEFEPFTFGLVEYFEMRKSILPVALERLISFAGYYESVFADRDVILSPTVTTPPPKIGFLAPTAGVDAILEKLMNYVGFTPFMNVAGAPAISLPGGQTSERLPIGFQLAAANGRERTLLEIAYELEEAQPWTKIAPLMR
ncbi:MAG: amidase [Parvularculaceae bacterium]